MTQGPVTVAGGHAVRVEDVPDPRVDERTTRCTYTAKYKIEILAEYERLDRVGKGALAALEAPHPDPHGSRDF